MLVKCCDICEKVIHEEVDLQELAPVLSVCRIEDICPACAEVGKRINFQDAILAEWRAKAKGETPPPVLKEEGLQTDFFTRLECLCRQRGISVSKMADQTGFTRSAVSSWRHGRLPRRKSIERLASELGVSPQYFACGYNFELDQTTKEQNK